MEVVDYDLWEVPPRWQFLRLETDSGLVGWGEPVVEGRAPSTATAVEELLEEYILGEDPRDIERHWERMYRGGFYRGGPVLQSALSGIDQALWDLKGKDLGVPVYELLGGKAREQIRLYQHVHGETPAEMAEVAATHVDSGFSALKFTPTDELDRVDSPDALDAAYERVAAVREAVGDGVDIALDFHGRVSKPMAKRLAVRLEDLDPMFYEEPVLAQHNNALPEVASKTSIPIATGERMFSRTDFRPVLESGAVDILQPDVSHAGGITELRKIATMADAYDVVVAPHSPLGPVSLAASLHVDACTSNCLIQEQVYHLEGMPNYLQDDSFLAFDDEGRVDLPPGPGLGVDVDVDALREAEQRDAWEVPKWFHGDGRVAEW